MNSNQIIGYTASGTTVVAYGIQFIHIVRCGSVEGISLPRTLLDTVSLALWVLYATRIEDFPLLIATACELLMSLCVGIIVVTHRCRRSPSVPIVKDWTSKGPPKGQKEQKEKGPPEYSTEVCIVYVQGSPA